MAHPLGVNNNASPLGVPADLQSADKKGSTYSIADLQSASSEFALLAPVLLADFKSAIVTHTAADCKSAETESVKSGEEWVKSRCKLFTPRNADKHRRFRGKGEE